MCLYKTDTFIDLSLVWGHTVFVFHWAPPFIYYLKAVVVCGTICVSKRELVCGFGLMMNYAPQ